MIYFASSAHRWAILRSRRRLLILHKLGLGPLSFSRLLCSWKHDCGHWFKLVGTKP